MNIDINQTKEILSNIESIKNLLQHSIAIQLYVGGATQEEISKKLKISTGKINQMVKGINRG